MLCFTIELCSILIQLTCVAMHIVVQFCTCVQFVLYVSLNSNEDLPSMSSHDCLFMFFLLVSNMKFMQAITSARVPIVKMSDPGSGFSCDICINNLFAVANTKLLKDYAQIDQRLLQLAFLVKHWAKLRGVNETYRGTLSSYA